MNTMARPITTSTPPVSMWVNVVLFQMGWFACVLGAAKGWPWAGVVVGLIIAVWHVLRATRPGNELKLVALTLLTGALWDSFLVQTGWIVYPTGTIIAGTAPLWILALWVLFAITLNVSMRWLKMRLWLAAVLGAISGPLSYWGASRLGAVQFAEPMPLVIALAAGWALIMPLLMWLSRRYE